MEKWIPVAGAHEIPPGASKVVRVLGQSVAVFNIGDGFCAVDNTCPHQGGPLGEGTLDGTVVTCPWHEWKYDVRTGCPVVTAKVRTFEARSNGAVVEIAVPREEIERYDRAAGGTHAEPDPINSILEQIADARTLDEVVDEIYRALQPIVPHNRLGIALLDGAAGRLVQIKTKSDRPILLDNGYAAPVAGSSLERILELGDPRVIDDLREHYRRRPSGWTKLLLDEGMASSLTLPLKVGGRPIGVVFFTSASPRAFTERHVGFLTQIAGQLSVVIEKGRWVGELAQSNERYRILFEMANEGIFLCSGLDRPLVAVNENLCRWVGYAREELSGRTLEELIVPSRAAEARALFRHVIETRTPAALETVLTTRSSGERPVEIRLVAVEQRGERFIQGFVRDLSEVAALKEQLRREQSFQRLVGMNHRMQEIYELIRQVAPTSTTVLIQGESGTGKELVARAIHECSPRRRKTFVAVNCGALVETLLESELFGHVRGAFTGAVADRRGRFELADEGTIFLDEIGDLALATQVKLLRVLQAGEFEKVGSTTTRRVNVRVIAATHRDLKAAVRAGTFREDLYYRLNVVPIVLPPLRERRDDIPRLAAHFIERFRQKTNKPIREVSPAAMGLLMDYACPGNVRELENIIEHAFVRCSGTVIEPANLPPDVTGSERDILNLALRATKPLLELEKRLIKRVLDESGGQTSMAAARLGISRTTLWRKLRAY